MAFAVGTQVKHKVSGDFGVVTGYLGDLVEVAFPGAKQLVPEPDLHVEATNDVEYLLGGGTSDPDLALLRLKARLILHSYMFDPGAGLSNARLEPQLHQAFVAHRVVARKVVPRMILADEVGLGKTIEAGLILKELRARRLASRTLIVTPASLTRQWQMELKSKFNEDFDLLDGSSAKLWGHGGANPFEARSSVICSLPFATSKKRADQVTEVPWDLVIFDEAHKVRRTKNRTTQAYKLAQQLADISSSGFLLLTATPVQLHSYELLSLIDLVEPGLFSGETAFTARQKQLPQFNSMIQLIQNWTLLPDSDKAGKLKEFEALFSELGVIAQDQLEEYEFRDELIDALIELHPTADVMIRNRKADLGIANLRRPRAISITMQPNEREIYDDVNQYVRAQASIAGTKANAAGFVAVVYQKMVTSSSHALRQSFIKRIAVLKSSLKLDKLPTVTNDTIEELREQEEAVDLVELAEKVRFDKSEAAAKAEIAFLEGLCERLKDVSDSKAHALHNLLQEVNRSSPQKAVIFTQYVQTQLFLQRLLEDWGYSCVVFNGGMNLEEKEAAIKRFRENSQILLSTEAGGEGRNLQFAHILINYDLPWNPMKVEQRIGRLDRIGQKSPVEIYNLVYRDTLEERVFEVLQDRIKLFEESVGALDPILGSLEAEFEKLALGSDTEKLDAEFAIFGENLEKEIEAARLKEKLLQDLVLDHASFRNDGEYRWLEDRPLATSDDLLHLMEDGLSKLGGALTKHVEGGHQLSLSSRLAAQMNLQTTTIHGIFEPRLALEKDEVDFFACGHPVIDQLLNYFSNLDDASVSARFVDEDLDSDALEIVWKLTAKIVVPEAKLVRHVIASDGKLISEPMRSVPASSAVFRPEPSVDFVKDAFEQSKQKFHEEFAEYRHAMLAKQDTVRQKKIRRTNRVYKNQRERLIHIISEEAAWVAEAEKSASAQNLKILPARRGRLDHRRSALRLLEAKYESDIEELENTVPDIRGEVFSVSILRGKNEANRVRR